MAAVVSGNLAQKQGTPVAQAACPGPELMACIDRCNGLCALGNSVAGNNVEPLGRLEHLRGQTQHIRDLRRGRHQIGVG